MTYVSQTRQTRTGFEPEGRGAIVTWTVTLFAASALSVVLWAGGGYLWTHPETKLGYAVMKKIGKLEPVKPFEAFEAPRGVFHTSRELSQKLLALSDLELREFNVKILRSYIRNYFKEDRNPVNYLYGRFNILEVERVGQGRFVPSGVVLLAQSEEAPELLLEYVLPTGESQIEAALALLRPGMPVVLQKSSDLGAVIRVVRQPDKRLIVTVINLLYGEYRTGEEEGRAFTCEPPAKLEPETGWPVFSRTKEVLARLDPVVPEQLNVQVAPVTRPTPAGTQALKPFAPPVENAPAPSTTQAASASTPTPVADMAVTLLDSQPGSPSEVIVSATQPEIPAVLPRQPAAPAEAEMPALATATPSPNPQGADSWPLFARGEVPPRMMVGVDRLPRLARDGMPPETLYLGGEFVVSAVGPGGVLMKAKGPELQPFLPDATERGTGNVRIIARFPPGARIPARGETVVRDKRRPFEIVAATISSDGSTNVWVREVTVP